MNTKKLDVFMLSVWYSFAIAATVDILEDFRYPWDRITPVRKFEDVTRVLCRSDEKDCRKQYEAMENTMQQEEAEDNHVLETNKRGKSNLVDVSSISYSCGMEKGSIDLGYSYFPRNIMTGECKTRCWKGAQKCKPIRYTLCVLRQKKSKDDDYASSCSLHRNLQDSWTAEKISVTVGCDCGP